MTPTAAEAVQSALQKLTVREHAALVAQVRREVRADEAARSRSDRPARVRELPEVAAAARRMIRAVGHRAGTDVEGLALLAGLRDDVDTALRDAVTAARAGEGLQGPGYSWADVGRVLGMTRQSAQQRFGRPGVT